MYWFTPPMVDAVERGVHTEVRSLTRVVRQLGGVQQRLGGDAPVVQTGAADLVGLDECHGLAELCGTERGSVATTSCAQDDDVESGAGVGHVQLLIRRRVVSSSRTILSSRPDGNDRGDLQIRVTLGTVVP
ncbi:hypothetical protein ACVW07_000621 [Cellulomonas sp. URHB0016]